MDRLLPPAAANAFSNGGSGVAFDGETLAVGYANNGTIEITRRDASGWVHEDSLGQPGPTVSWPGAFDVSGDANPGVTSNTSHALSITFH